MFKKISNLFRRVSLLEKALFAKHLAVMLKSGITLSEALTILAEQSRGSLKKIIEQLLTNVRSGHTLAEGLEKFSNVFSPVFINLIKTGEASGTLERNLNHLANQLEKEITMRKKVRGATMYPTLVLAVTFGLGFAIAIFVLPRLKQVFAGLKLDLPLTTRILLAVAGFFEHFGLQTILGLIILIFFLSWLWRQKFIKPYTHYFLLHLPFIGPIVKNMYLARFTRTLGTLLNSGLPIIEALKITKQATENILYQRSVDNIIYNVGAGKNIANSLTNHFLYPKIAVRIIEIGERTGNLGGSLLYLAEFYETEVDHIAANLSTILEPVLLIIIGLVVGFVAISIISPIYQITASLE